MQTIDTNMMLSGLSELDVPALERFLAEAAILLARKKATSLPETEAKLLNTINNSLPELTRIRYRALRKKQQAKELTSAERIELLSLVEVVENADVQRLKAMVELARIRNVSLDTLAAQLGHSSPHEVT